MSGARPCRCLCPAAEAISEHLFEPGHYRIWENHYLKESPRPQEEHPERDGYDEKPIARSQRPCSKNRVAQ